MPLRFSNAICAVLFTGCQFLLVPDVATAQTVLAGTSFEFVKDDGADFTLPENQDRITPSVWLTRDLTGGLFNAKFESFFVPRDPTVISPVGTEWATSLTSPGEMIASANWESLTFDTWLHAFGGSAGIGHDITNYDAVLRIVGDEESDLDDVYMEIRFTSWSQGGGGGFAYSRSRFPTGDYNDDEVVNAADYTTWRNTLGQMVPNGTGADGEPDGVIDVADYEFWKQHFGQAVPGAGAGGRASVVPEPTAALLMLFGLLSATITRTISPRGPGQTFGTKRVGDVHEANEVVGTSGGAFLSYALGDAANPSSFPFVVDFRGLLQCRRERAVH